MPFYFYNPFFENVHRDNHIDEDVELSAQRFESDVRAALDALARARVGVRVVTLPWARRSAPSRLSALVTKEAAGSDILELWVKTDGATGTDLDDDAGTAAPECASVPRPRRHFRFRPPARGPAPAL